MVIYLSQNVKDNIKYNLLTILFLIGTGFSSISVAEKTVESTCISNTIPSTPTSDFIVHNDGTVSHNKTGLMWKQCTEGQEWNSEKGCVGFVLGYEWEQALVLPDAINRNGGFAEHNDWRLPSIKELESIIETTHYSPAINLKVFNATPSEFYWSYSPNRNHSGYSWGVHFDHGRVEDYSRSFDNLIRLVRDEKIK